MRASDKDFCKFLKNIGDGNVDNFEISDVWKTNDICSKIYGDNLKQTDSVFDRVILSDHNENNYKYINLIKKI